MVDTSAKRALCKYGSPTKHCLEGFLLFRSMCRLQSAAPPRFPQAPSQVPQTPSLQTKTAGFRHRRYARSSELGGIKDLGEIYVCLLAWSQKRSSVSEFGESKISVRSIFFYWPWPRIPLRPTYLVYLVYGVYGIRGVLQLFMFFNYSIGDPNNEALGPKIEVSDPKNKNISNQIMGLHKLPIKRKSASTGSPPFFI